jgi:hypothetical protein
MSIPSILRKEKAPCEGNENRSPNSTNSTLHGAARQTPLPQTCSVFSSNTTRRQPPHDRDRPNASQWVEQGIAAEQWAAEDSGVNGDVRMTLALACELNLLSDDSKYAQEHGSMGRVKAKQKRAGALREGKGRY